MTEERIAIPFPKSAHGFKLSVQYNNRLYYYPDEEYRMDMRDDLPKGKWIIDEVKEWHKLKTVVLKKVE